MHAFRFISPLDPVFSPLCFLSLNALVYASPLLSPFDLVLSSLSRSCFLSFLSPREGTDVSIVTFSKMVGTALEAAEVLTAKGISAEVRKCRHFCLFVLGLYYFECTFVLLVPFLVFW